MNNQILPAGNTGTLTGATTHRPPEQNQFPANWPRLTAANLSSIPFLYPLEQSRLTVPMSDPGLQLKFELLHACCLAMNIEGRFDEIGRGDLRTSKNVSIGVNVWAPAPGSADQQATMEFQRLRGDRGAFWEDYRTIADVMSGKSTVDQVAARYQNRPLSSTSSHAQQALETILANFPPININVEQEANEAIHIAHQNLQQPGIGLMRCLEALSSLVDPSKTVKGVAILAANAVVTQSDEVMATTIRTAISTPITDFADLKSQELTAATNGHDTDGIDNSNATQTAAILEESHATAHAALTVLSKALEVHRMFTAPGPQQADEATSSPISDTWTNEHLLTALIIIAGAPNGNQHLSTLAFNCLNLLRRDETTATRLQQLPRFAQLTEAAATFINHNTATAELEQAAFRHVARHRNPYPYIDHLRQTPHNPHLHIEQVKAAARETSLVDRRDFAEYRVYDLLYNEPPNHPALQQAPADFGKIPHEENPSHSINSARIGFENMVTIARFVDAMPQTPNRDQS